ncbi:hypothetical protein HHK36_014244 [Tetracentron sinense]|uniref:Mitochondrial import inner membrane translocase subunit TIM17-2-like n=1 Tax=Tetracentron sinense TaxID=13715 RepID=A0A834ZBV6_TETSI|nr:hypothetical protein HHK36_014244 [Tetracentron sinense]
MGTPETSREPCPDRILDDIGGAFGMGAVGGSAFHFLKGIYNSPKGERLIGGSQAVRMNAPRVGGSFAVWGGLFSAFDCTMVYVRQKEDPWNSIIAGAATGGFLQMRQGLGPASRSAMFGGVLLALIEGAGIMLNKVLSAPQNLPPMEEPFPNMAESIPNMAGGPRGYLPNPNPTMEASGEGSSSSWFGGFFGGEKKQESGTNGASKTEILESFDTPIPSFEYKEDLSTSERIDDCHASTELQNTHESTPCLALSCLPYIYTVYPSEEIRRMGLTFLRWSTEDNAARSMEKWSCNGGAYRSGGGSAGYGGDSEC